MYFIEGVLIYFFNIINNKNNQININNIHNDLSSQNNNNPLLNYEINKNIKNKIPFSLNNENNKNNFVNRNINNIIKNNKNNIIQKNKKDNHLHKRNPSNNIPINTTNNFKKINNNINNNINNIINDINNININNNLFNKVNNNINNKNIFNNVKHHRSKSAGDIKVDKNKISLYHANGLENVGATCYMNATLQCLANVKKLTEFFLKFENIQNILSNPVKYKLTNSYLEVLNNLWLNTRIKYYAPNNFKSLISIMNPLFAGVQANDSKDLILFLMETMHNELNTAKKINPPNSALNQYDYQKTFQLFSKYFKNNYKSPFSDLFYGMYNSMMTCNNCNTTSHNVQCYNILIFPLEEVRKYKNINQNIVDIRECFEYYQKDDYMSGENQIFCNNCHKMSNCQNKTKLIICPNVLVINLNRGKGLQYDIKITLKEYLNLKDFVYYDKSPSYYELIGIVTHFGPSSMGGHFIAFCKSFIDLNWYKYNDADVSSSSFQEASTTGVPYILFYSYIKS